MKVKVLLAQLCLTLCDPVDCSPPGCSVHGILPARILEWVAMSFSRGSSQSRDCLLHCRQILYCLSYPGSPEHHIGACCNRLLVHSRTSLLAQMVKICLQFRRPGFHPWVRKIPWRREWLYTLVFLPAESLEQKSLAGYSPWGHEKLDTTAKLTLVRPQGPRICFFRPFLKCLCDRFHCQKYAFCLH